MDRGNFEPKKDVQEYLQYNFHIKIFEELTENRDYQNLFDPLEFFNLLSEQIYIVKKNSQRPLDVVFHLKGLDLDKHQLHYLLKKLMGSFNHKSFPFHLQTYKKNEDDKIALRFIRKEYKKLDDELFQQAEPEKQATEETNALSSDELKFHEVRQHVDRLESTEERINYLNSVKTSYMQDNWQNYHPDYPLNNRFLYNCDLEIKKHQDLMDAKRRSPDIRSDILFNHLTNSQVVLVFYYFFKYCGLELRKNIDISTMAKFIHLLSGKDYTGVDNSDYYKKLKNNVPNFKSDKQLKNDLLIIKPFFQQTELKEIVKMIDNEIEMCKQ
jgi:hypothetical protein